MSITMREIGRQPKVPERTLRSEKNHVLRVAERVRRGDIRFIALVARGTSDNAALFERYLLEITTGTPVSLAVLSVHALYRRRLHLRQALVVGISQSGEGTDVNVVLESCKKSGACVLAITNHGQPTMAGIAHETFVTRAGPERSVAAAKTCTSQLMVLHTVAVTLCSTGFEPLYRIPDSTRAVVAAGVSGDEKQGLRHLDLKWWDRTYAYMRR